MSSNSASGLLSTLIPSLLLAILFVALFLLFRTKQKRIYLPRTYLDIFTEQEKTPTPPPTKISWFRSFVAIDDAFLLNHHSLDAFFFLRFWRLAVLLCGVGMPFTWLILMPVYGTSHGRQTQLDRVSFANINTNRDAARLWAVALIAVVVLGAVMICIGREAVYAAQVTSAYLRLPRIAQRLSSRTVLFTSVPDNLTSSDALFSQFPSARHVWLARDTSSLEELISDRDKAAAKLEVAIVKMSKAANNKRLKAWKKEKKSGEGFELHESSSTEWTDGIKRPEHRLKPLIGKKVDSITWSRERVDALGALIAKEQANASSARVISAAFVEFDTAEAAQATCGDRKTSGGAIPRAVGMAPESVVWKNLGMNSKKRRALSIAVVAVICLLIIFWLPLVAIIGLITNINSLTDKVPFLGFINDIPGPILGIVTGLLPVVLLAVLLALVPIIMRLLFKAAGAVTTAEIELKTQTWYFVFQVIQVFLVTTISSGAAATVTTIIQNPSQAATLLAKNLPKASNFYINFFVLYGVALAASTLFNIVAVLLFIILGKFLDTTPRKMFRRYVNVAGVQWGSVYPKFANLVVIAITYSCIAPLMLFFATLGFFLLSWAHRYALIYALDTTSLDTRGAAYAKAISQLTTGVYLAELCLIGLMSISSASSAVAAGPLVVVILLFAATIVYHILLNRTVAKMQEQRGVTDAEDPFSDPPSLPRLARLLRPAALPTFSDYLYSTDDNTSPAMSPSEHADMYAQPAISSKEPIIWIVQDGVGLSKREKAQGLEHASIVDEGAWWNEEGKLTTGWMEEERRVREVPIWEESKDC